MAKAKEPKTHFEQVPLEIVKKIAEIPDDAENGKGPRVVPPAKKTRDKKVVRRTGK
jgi:hypothetical protein